MKNNGSYRGKTVSEQWRHQVRADPWLSSVNPSSYYYYYYYYVGMMCRICQCSCVLAEDKLKIVHGVLACRDPAVFPLHTLKNIIQLAVCDRDYRQNLL